MQLKTILAFSILLSKGLFAQTLTPAQIVDKAQEAIKVKGIEAVSTMRILDDKGNERVRTIAQITKVYDNGDTEKRMIRFMSPADVKNTGLLTFDYKSKDDDIWLYMPALRKTRRIVSSDKSKNFMGSEFSYADMTPPSLDEFDFQMLDDEEVRGALCYQIVWIPKTEEVAEENGFSKRITWIGKDDFVIRKAIYEDVDGEPLKELNVYEIREMDPENHTYRMIHMEMENLQNGRKSIMDVDKIRFNPDVSDESFTTRFLEKE